MEPKKQSVFTTLPGILTGIAAIVTAAAGLIAVLTAGGDPRLPVEPSPSVVVVASTTPTPTPTQTATATATGTATPEPRSVPGDWPADRSAYTVILSSEETRGEAEAVVAQARGNLPTVGVLRSRDFPSLRPGWWVAFSGAFDTRAGAQVNADDARSAGFPSAYVRFVE